jgi:hypothetical protein
LGPDNKVGTPGKGAMAAVAALVALGMLGGSLVVAAGGFATRPRLGGPATFVPAPLGYLPAVLLYGMSLVGLLVLLRRRRGSRLAIGVALVLYVGCATALTWVLRSL